MISRGRAALCMQEWNIGFNFMPASFPDVSCRPPVVRLTDFSYAYEKDAAFLLKDVNLDIKAGECHCLTGPTGSGKSTFLMAIRDLLPPGREQGAITFPASCQPSKARPGYVGLLLQNPETQILGTSLGAEVAFGLENHCIPPVLMPGKVCEALQYVGLNRSLDTDVEHLSMGQKYRAVLASLLVMNPALLLLDEPAAQMDPHGLAKLTGIIQKLKEKGAAVLLTDHRPHILAPVIDVQWHIENGVIRRETRGRKITSPTCPGCSVYSKTDQTKDSFLSNPGKKNLPVIDVKNLSVAPGNDPKNGFCLWSGLSFHAARGERIAICGPNGSGKTALTRVLTGFLTPAVGTVKILGDAPDARRLRGRVGVLFQNPGKQIFENTVLEETLFSIKRFGKTHNASENIAYEMLSRLGIADLWERSPHKLSYGQKHLAALASVLAGQPEILILDDPFAGLDPDYIRIVTKILSDLCDQTGLTVIWTVHDTSAIPGWAHRIIRLPQSHTSGVKTDAFNKTQRHENHRQNKKNSTGAHLCVSMLLSMTAFAARTPLMLAGLTIINLSMLFFLSPNPLAVFGRSLRFFVWQGGLIVMLYFLRFGGEESAFHGIIVAWQLFMAFWPGMIFMASTPRPRIVRTLSKVMPDLTAFVVSTCLKFMPRVIREMESIREAQILRGASVMIRDLKYPKNWKDWINCLMVPVIVQTLSLAVDIATAATARDFGVYKKRTCWPED